MTGIDGRDAARAPGARPADVPGSGARVLARDSVRKASRPPSPADAATVSRAVAALLPAAGLSGNTRVNCFTPGTMIATPRGAVAVERLKPGDMVITRDNGPQEIRWAGRQHLAGAPLRLDTRLQPVTIRAGALGPGVPERDLQLSPNHRVLLLGDHPSLDVAEAEVFVSARHLIGTRGIERTTVTETCYLHFMCDRHEVVLSNGAWTESFQPSVDAMQGVSQRAREELFALFPELAATGPKERFGTARPIFGAQAVRRIRA